MVTLKIVSSKYVKDTIIYKIYTILDNVTNGGD